jgi:KDO2-lipid IV(A) lauroyltransferase
VLVDEGARYRLVLGRTWRPDPARSAEDNLRDGAVQFHRFLEEQVRAHPENYFWAHRRWKTRPPERGA